jgi:hypothetical protein
MRSIRYGLLAGALAGMLLVLLLFFDEGPGNQFMFVAQTLGLDGRGGSRGLAALVMFILAIIVGALFGALLRQPSASRTRPLLWGLAVGVLWWAVLFVLLGDVVRRLQFPLYWLLLYLVLSLVYGLVLGSLYTTMQQKANRQPGKATRQS